MSPTRVWRDEVLELRKGKLLWVFLAVTTFTIGEAAAQEGDRFGLFTDCGAVPLIVEELPTAAKDLGLTKRRLQTVVEAALLGARIPTTDSLPPHYIYLSVNVVGRSFSVRLEFKKWVFDSLLSSESGIAVTWSTGSLGTHGGNAEYIVSIVRGSLDEFVAAYLRTNLAECDFG